MVSVYTLTIKIILKSLFESLRLLIQFLNVDIKIIIERHNRFIDKNHTLKSFTKH